MRKPRSKQDVTYASPEFDPLWQAAQELDMPLAMHNFTQGESKVVRSRFEVFASAASDVQQFRDHVFLTFMDDMAGIRHDRTPSRSDAARMLRVHKEGAP